MKKLIIKMEYELPIQRIKELVTGEIKGILFNAMKGEGKIEVVEDEERSENGRR